MKLIEDTGAGGTPVLALEGGDSFFKESPIPAELRAQSHDKAELIARAYAKALDAFVPGELDLAEGPEAFRALVEKHKVPVVAANLVDAKGARVFPASRLKTLGGTRVLVVGVVDPAHWPDNPVLRATEPITAIQAALKDAPAHDVAVLVAHAEAGSVARWVEYTPHFSFVLTSHSGQLFFQPKVIPLPSGSPVKEALTFASSRGGKYVARLRVKVRKGNRTFVGGETRSRARFTLQQAEKRAAGNPADATLKKVLAEAKATWDAQNTQSYTDFDSVALEQELPEDATLAALVKQYNAANAEREAKVAGAAPVVSQLPVDGPFAGAAACKNCHAQQYEVWQKSDHSHAVASLRKSNQQLDRECVGCHSMGYQQPGGYSDPAMMGGFGEVQCESCHGPARVHALTADKTKVKRGAGEATCRQCHTPDATPQFRFDRDRLRIKHWSGP